LNVTTAQAFHGLKELYPDLWAATAPICRPQAAPNKNFVSEVRLLQHGAVQCSGPAVQLLLAGTLAWCCALALLPVHCTAAALLLFVLLPALFSACAHTFWRQDSTQCCCCCHGCCSAARPILDTDSCCCCCSRCFLQWGESLRQGSDEAWAPYLASSYQVANLQVAKPVSWPNYRSLPCFVLHTRRGAAPCTKLPWPATVLTRG
jgi:hypothetical protein